MINKIKEKYKKLYFLGKFNEYEKKQLKKESLEAVLYILLLEIVCQIVYSVVSINGYSMQISIFKSFLLKDLLFIPIEVHITDGRVGFREWRMLISQDQWLKKDIRRIMPHVKAFSAA